MGQLTTLQRTMLFLLLCVPSFCLMNWDPFKSVNQSTFGPYPHLLLGDVVFMLNYLFLTSYYFLFLVRRLRLRTEFVEAADCGRAFHRDWGSCVGFVFAGAVVAGIWGGDSDTLSYTYPRVLLQIIGIVVPFLLIRLKRLNKSQEVQEQKESPQRNFREPME